MLAHVFTFGIAATLIAANICAQAKQVATRDEIVIGYHSFFDFGPPFNFYEVYVLLAEGDKTRVDRLSLTPPSGQCTELSTYAHESEVLDLPMTAVLQKRDPCSISDKQLKHEGKRKRGSQFSGANLVMQLSCSGKDRLIPMSILEEDLFSISPHAPSGVSWTMNIMEVLNSKLGSNVTDRPAFSIGEVAPNSIPVEGELEAQLRAGEYDFLFPSPPRLLSRMYAESLQTARKSVDIEFHSSVTPITAPQPTYPPIARAARVSGTLRMKGLITKAGDLENITRTDGSLMFLNTTEAALKRWKFSPESAGQDVLVDFQFGLNCTTQTRDPDLPR